MTSGRTKPRLNWRIAIRRYLVAIAQAVLHCTFDHLLIGTVALIAILAAFGSSAWPNESGACVAVATVIVEVGYMVYSEYWILPRRSSPS